MGGREYCRRCEMLPISSIILNKIGRLSLPHRERTLGIQISNEPEK